MNIGAETIRKWIGLTIACAGAGIALVSVVNSVSASRAERLIRSRTALEQAWPLIVETDSLEFTGSQFREAENLERARKLIAEQALILYKKNAQAHVYLGIYYLAKCRYESAHESFRKAVVINRDSRSALGYLGISHLMNNNCKPAKASFDRAIELSSWSAVHLHNRGIANMCLGEFKDAIRDFEAATRIKPAFGPSYNALGVALQMQTFPHKSAEAFRHALEIDSQDPYSLGNLGRSLSYEAGFERAIEYFESAVAADPNHCSSYSSLGFSYSAIGRHAESAHNYAEAIKCAPLSPHNYIGRGIALAYTGQHEVAISSLQKAVELDADLAEGHNALGGVFFMQGHYPAAADAFKTAIRKNPLSTSAQRNLAVALRALDGQFGIEITSPFNQDIQGPNQTPSSNTVSGQIPDPGGYLLQIYLFHPVD